MTTPPPPPPQLPPPEPAALARGQRPRDYSYPPSCEPWAVAPPPPSNLPAGLEPLPDPRDWTYGPVDRSTIDGLIEDGYPSDYAAPWGLEVNTFLNCVADGGTGGGGDGGVDLPPEAPGDPAADLGPPPTGQDYIDWDALADSEDPQ